MLRLLVLSLALVAPADASALSCLPWQVEDAFTEAAESPDAYLIVRGVLHFDERDMPVVDWDKQADVPPETDMKARLKGKSLGYSGFKTSFSAPVTFTLSCAGPWCPSAASGSLVLAFVKRGGGDHQITLGPCGGMVFQSPSRDMISRVHACLKDGQCNAPAR